MPVAVVAQRGEGLAARIAAAHADAAALHPGRPTLQVGMDTPQATAELLSHCAERLAEPGVDAVLGPATDGGWWVLGLRDPLAATALHGVPMSTAETGDRTLDALRAAGLRVALAEPLTDVDTAAEAVALAAQVPGSRFARAVVRPRGSSSAVDRSRSVNWPTVSAATKSIPPPTRASAPRRDIVGGSGSGATSGCAGSGRVAASGVASSVRSDRPRSDRTIVGSFVTTCSANEARNTQAAA